MSEILNKKISQLSHEESNSQPIFYNSIIQGREQRVAPVRQVSTWTQQQLDKISNGYLEAGSSWTLIQQRLTSKSINTIKNKFNNTLRMAGKMLAEFEIKVMKRHKESINRQLLLTVLEIVNQTQREVKDRKLTINWESKLFTFKSQILNYCFKSKDFTMERTEQLIKLTNSINYKMRTCAVFKKKHFKSWQISQKVLNFIFTFDRFVKEQIDKFDQQEQTKSLTAKKEKNQKKSKDINFSEHSQSQQPLKNLIDIQSIIKYNLSTLNNSQGNIYEYESLIGEEQQQKYFKF